MNGASALLLALAVGAAVADWVAVERGSRRVEYVAKPLTLALLVGAAVALDADDPAARTWFVVALSLSLLGDVFLVLPRDAFLQGLSAFLLAHVAYVVGFQVRGLEAIPLALGVVAAATAVGVVGRKVLAGVRAAEPRLAGPVTAYMAVIGAMAASAVGTGNLPAAAGASLFVASDAMIAWDRFVQREPWARLAIIVTYHTAQVGLVLSLL